MSKVNVPNFDFSYANTNAHNFKKIYQSLYKIFAFFVKMGSLLSYDTMKKTHELIIWIGSDGLDWIYHIIWRPQMNGKLTVRS